MRRDIVGHGGQQRVALLARRARRGDSGPRQQDLQIHFVVGGVDAGGIVDRVGVDASAGTGIFDAAQLRDAQIGAFADHLGAHLAAIDAHRVIGAVADVEIGSARPP